METPLKKQKWERDDGNRPKRDTKIVGTNPTKVEVSRIHLEPQEEDVSAHRQSHCGELTKLTELRKS